jgi:hypothetical protein
MSTAWRCNFELDAVVPLSLSAIASRNRITVGFTGGQGTRSRDCLVSSCVTWLGPQFLPEDRPNAEGNIPAKSLPLTMES